MATWKLKVLNCKFRNAWLAQVMTSRDITMLGFRTKNFLAKNFCLEILKNKKYWLNKFLQKSKIFSKKNQKNFKGLKNFCLEILKNEKYWLNKFLQKSKIFSKKKQKNFYGQHFNFRGLSIFTYNLYNFIILKFYMGY